jgi:hypothetical protein
MPPPVAFHNIKIARLGEKYGCMIWSTNRTAVKDGKGSDDENNTPRPVHYAKVGLKHAKSQR